ncbi:MAG: DUF433 domain-containing protein, partial [Bacteroidetes bacterium]
ITFNPDILAGKATIRGMRISARLLINLLANGKTRKDILEEYPDLEEEDIIAALQYAERLMIHKQTCF